MQICYCFHKLFHNLTTCQRWWNQNQSECYVEKGGVSESCSQSYGAAERAGGFRQTSTVGHSHHYQMATAGAPSAGALGVCHKLWPDLKLALEAPWWSLMGRMISIILFGSDLCTFSSNPLLFSRKMQSTRHQTTNSLFTLHTKQ